MSVERSHRMVVLGAGGVGKSALTIRFVHNTFVERYDPTIEDSYRTPVCVDGEMIMAEILDTAGTDAFTAMRDLYMKNGDGFLLVFSIVSRGSFVDLPDLVEQIYRVKDCDDVPLTIIGNKADLGHQRVVCADEAELFAAKHRARYLETSALNHHNVSEAFVHTMRMVNAMKRKRLTNTKKRKANDKCSIL